MENNDYKNMLLSRSYNFSLDMIRLIDALPKGNLSARVIAHQIIRSATSIGANIVEAQASSSRKDFTNFISYSLKSANETKYWLGLLKDSKQGDAGKLEGLLREVTELSKLLGSSILSLKNRK